MAVTQQWSTCLPHVESHPSLPSEKDLAWGEFGRSRDDLCWEGSLTTWFTCLTISLGWSRGEGPGFPFEIRSQENSL